VRGPAAAAFRLILLILCWPCVVSFAAEVRVTLPLEGHYRAGRYMPVRVEVRGAAAGAVLRLTGEGIIPTHVETANGRAEGVAPVLPLTEAARELRWSLGEETGVVGTPLRALAERERFIGYASAVDAAIAGQVFPETAVVGVRVDPGELARTEAGLWQALDAVILDAAQLTKERLEAFVAAGVAVVAGSGEVPPEVRDWGWEEVHGVRVLRPALLGPGRAGVSADAFAPVQGWRAELPRAFRMRVLLYGALVVVLILGAGLLKGRVAITLIVLVSLGSALLLHRWWRARTPELERVGGVFVVDGSKTQYDVWSYRTAVAPVAQEGEWTLATWPFFRELENVRGMSFYFVCRANGAPRRYRYEVASGRMLGLMTRTVRGGVEKPEPGAGESAMERLARRLYVRPGYSVAGELSIALPEVDLLSESCGVTVVRRDSVGSP
jgi:hypothetical protein